MLQHQTHIMRRFCIHERAPRLDMKTIKAALPEANRLNAEIYLFIGVLAFLVLFALWPYLLAAFVLYAFAQGCSSQRHHSNHSNLRRRCPRCKRWRRW